MIETPFRFGVLSHGRTSRREWRELAREAEQLGYSILQVPQHFSMRIAPAMVALVIAAEATATLRVGTLVIDNELVHPAIVGNDAQWLSELTDRRFELGIGAGWLSADHAVLGRELGPPGERVSRLVEAVTLIRQQWAHPALDFEGSHYRVRGLDIGPERPCGRVPLLVGGGRPRVLALAAAQADIVSIVADMRSGRIGSDSARTATKAATIEKVAHVRAVAGDRFGDLELHTMMTGVFSRSDPRASRAARAYGVEADALDEVPSILVGETSEIIEQIVALRAATGISFVTVPEDAMERFAPVVAELAQ